MAEPNEDRVLQRARLLDMISGFERTQMLHVVARLRIADHLAQGPKSAADLSLLTGTHEDSLYRLMRALAALGVFFEEEGRRFRLAPMGELLRSDVTGSLRLRAEVNGQEWVWRPWGSLMHSVRTGEVAFDHLYGKTTWQWFADNPEPAALFNSLMDTGSDAESQAIVHAYDFSRVNLVVDVGGGQGRLLSTILAANDHLQGILFDLPNVIESARSLLDASCAEQIQLEPGDFHWSVPAGGDLYVLKKVIHNWKDEQARLILEACRRAMQPDGKLLLAEFIIGPPNTPGRAVASDITMMVRNGGFNRTEGQYRTLLASAGFSLDRILRTGGGPELLEASPTG